MANKVRLTDAQLRDAERWSWVTSALSAACSAAAYAPREQAWIYWLGVALAFAALASFWRRKRLARS